MIFICDSQSKVVLNVKLTETGPDNQNDIFDNQVEILSTEHRFYTG